MRTVLAFFFALIAVLSVVNVCGGTTSDADNQEVNDDTSAITSDLEENEEVQSIAEEIENELEEAIADMMVENEENAANAGASKSNLPLMFPSLTKTSKSHRKVNQEMAVKVASIIEQAMMLVANDILQTTILLQTDPEEFLQSTNSTE